MKNRIGDFLKKKKDDKKVDLSTTQEKLERRKNTALAVILGFVVVVLIGGTIWSFISTFKTFTTERKERSKRFVSTLPKDKLVGKQRLEAEWRSIMENEVSKNRKDLKKFKQEVKERFDNMELQLSDIRRKTATKDDLEGLKLEIQDSLKRIENSLNVVQRQPVAGKVKDGKKGDVKVTYTGDKKKEQEYTGEKKLVEATKMKVVKPQQQVKLNRVVFSSSVDEQKDGIKKEDLLYIPMGFATGVAISGMDAPTFQWGQQDPQPMLISVANTMITAGGREIDLTDCLVLVSGAGSVSSERALLRLVKMECRDIEGNLYIGSVEGWVLGDDGKVGMQGRLVTRYGSVAAKAFMAGILDGIGSILKESSSNLETTALGVTRTTINPEDATKAALGSGLSSASSKLQDFYIKILEKIYPVVEILPGRRVTVVFKGDAVLQKVKDDDIFNLAASVNGGDFSKQKKAKVDTGVN